MVTINRTHNRRTRCMPKWSHVSSTIGQTFAGSCTLSEYFPSSYYYAASLLSLLDHNAEWRMSLKQRSRGCVHRRSRRGRRYQKSSIARCSNIVVGVRTPTVDCVNKNTTSFCRDSSALQSRSCTCMRSQRLSLLHVQTSISYALLLPACLPRPRDKR